VSNEYSRKESRTSRKKKVLREAGQEFNYFPGGTGLTVRKKDETGPARLTNALAGKGGRFSGDLR